MKELNRRIKQKRQKLGLTLREVADRLGVQEATVQRYESGKIKNIKHETVRKLAEILRCSPSWLMGFDIPSKSESEMVASKIRNGLFVKPPISRNDSPPEDYELEETSPDEDDFLANLSEEAIELLEIFNDLNVKNRTKLLMYAYELESGKGD